MLGKIDEKKKVFGKFLDQNFLLVILKKLMIRQFQNLKKQMLIIGLNSKWNLNYY